MSEGMPRGKTAQELRAEYERLRALADQDLIDLNSGRVRPADSLQRMVRARCSTCNGYGLWDMGDPRPMGRMDAADGMPTQACHECGENANPRP